MKQAGKTVTTRTVELGSDVYPLLGSNLHNQKQQLTLPVAVNTLKADKVDAEQQLSQLDVSPIHALHHPDSRLG